MTHQIAASLRRALRPASTGTSEDVHFHIGSDGRAFPCDHWRCESPGLTSAEAVQAWG